MRSARFPQFDKLVEAVCVCPFAVDYWLGHCEGFRVDSEDGHVGFVEAVLPSAETGDPATLLVRDARLGGRLVAVPVDEIDDFAVDAERIVLRRAPAPALPSAPSPTQEGRLDDR